MCGFLFLTNSHIATPRIMVLAPTTPWGRGFDSYLFLYANLGTKNKRKGVQQRSEWRALDVAPRSGCHVILPNPHLPEKFLRTLLKVSKIYHNAAASVVM